MPRLTPVHWKKLVCVFEKAGFKLERQTGDHLVYSKAGVLRPIVIPKYNAVGRDIIQSNLKSACITRERYFKLLRDC